MEKAQYFVVRHEGEWKIRHDGKHFGPYTTQQRAIKAAMEAMQQSGLEGFEAQVLVQGTDGTFGTEWTYQDPAAPKT
jgi:hypothetical protein